MANPVTQRRRLFFIVGTLCLLLIFGYVGRISFIRVPVEFVLSPLLQAGYATASWIGNIPRPLQQKTNLVAENNQLRNENERLIQENSMLRALKEEDKITQRMTEFFNSIDQQGVEAHVIGKSLTQQHLLIIDKGSDSGILPGLAVITENGILVGTIESVQPKTSYVLLITDTSQNIAAKIQNDVSSPGVVKGEFGLALRMQLIPQNDPIQINQTVVTSALEPRIPPNVLIGSITDIQKKEGSVFQEAKIVSPVQLDRIEIVSVVLPAL